MAKKKTNRRTNYQAPGQTKKKATGKANGSASKATSTADASASKEVPKKAAAKSQATKPKAQASAKTKAVPTRPSRGRPNRSASLSWWLLGGGIVGVIVLIIVLTSVLGEDQTGVTDADAWDLPSLDVDTDPDGDGRVTLAEFEGKPLIVNFFASWCVSCDRELPIFRQAIDDFSEEVQIVFANSNETGNWRPMAERGGIDDQILIDDVGGSRNNGLYRSLGGTGGMPLTAFYDAQGNLARVFPGEFDANLLYNAIQDITES